MTTFTAPLHPALVLTCGATALRWSDILWEEGEIRVCKRWAKGADGETKTDASHGYVPMHPILAGNLCTWHGQTPYAKESDFVFLSFRARGRVPLSASVFVAYDLRPAAKKAGVQIEQGVVRHSKIQTTLDLYTQEDSDEARAAQREFLMALGVSTNVVQ